VYGKCGDDDEMTSQLPEYFILPVLQAGSQRRNGHELPDLFPAMSDVISASGCHQLRPHCVRVVTLIGSA
jgi:hypothetical protein